MSDKTQKQDAERVEAIGLDEAPRVDHVLDVVGLYCPLPIIRTAALVRRLAPGEIVEVQSDDPVALEDMPRWCLTSGHELLGWLGGRPAGLLRFFVRVARGRLPRRAEL